MPLLVRATLTRDPIYITELCSLVSDESCGAVVAFTGDVRNHDGGRRVATLTYEIHPTTHDQIKLIAQSVIDGRDVVKVAVAHRYGEIPIGETAFAVVVSAHHRQSAFEAASMLVDEIKAKLPIWKHQVFIDGTDEWVNTA